MNDNFDDRLKREMQARLKIYEMDKKSHEEQLQTLTGRFENNDVEDNWHPNPGEDKKYQHFYTDTPSLILSVYENHWKKKCWFKKLFKSKKNLLKFNFLHENKIKPNYHDDLVIKDFESINEFIHFIESHKQKYVAYDLKGLHRCNFRGIRENGIWKFVDTKCTFIIQFLNENDSYNSKQVDTVPLIMTEREEIEAHASYAKKHYERSSSRYKS